MYGSKKGSKTPPSTGRASGGSGGFLLPQTGVKSSPIHTCRCGAHSSSGSCPRGHTK